MKKTYALLLGLILVATQFAYSQKSTQNQNKGDAQLASETFTKKDYNRWSMYLDFGLNSFFGDMKYDVPASFKKPLDHWNAGGGFEYTFNPMFSLGLGYTFMSVSHSDDAGSFESTIHNVYPYLGVNFLNYPLFNRNRRWDLWFTAGVGYAYHTPELVYTLTGDNAGNGFDNASAAVVPLGVELSFDITRQLAIALKAKWFLYNDDNLEGAKNKLMETDPLKNYTYSGVSNDFIGTVNLGLRWNFTKKGDTHMKKVSWQNYVPRETQLEGVMARLDSVENKVDNLELTPIIITETNSSTVAGGAGSSVCVIEPIFIYFDFDKADLKQDALAEILKVATILYEHPELDVEIIGYTDIKGSDPYNEKLSQRRAEAAKNELINIWQISSDRILKEGRGKALSPKPESSRYYSINRRCEFRFHWRNSE